MITWNLEERCQLASAILANSKWNPKDKAEAISAIDAAQSVLPLERRRPAGYHDVSSFDTLILFAVTHEPERSAAVQLVTAQDGNIVALVTGPVEVTGNVIIVKVPDWRK